jgi:signal transduction histidine kinase
LDPEKIRQALLNIFLNAVQVMNNNGKIFVETKLINDNENLDIDVKQKTAWVKIVVTDTGPGIPNDILNKVFDPFVTNRKKGTGLGLSITHSIIAEHKGKISVTNVKQGGAKFIISLPLIEKKYVSAGVIK